MILHTSPPCRLPKNGHTIRITPKPCNIPLNPLQSQRLILQRVISWYHTIPSGKETQRTLNPKSTYFMQQKLKTFTKPIIRYNKNDVFVHQKLRSIPWCAAGTAKPTASMEENHDGQRFFIIVQLFKKSTR